MSYLDVWYAHLDVEEVFRAFADRLTACDIDRKPRGKEKASDHTPIWCDIA